MTSTENLVESTVERGVLSLALNRPTKLNAVTYAMIGELLAQLDRAATDESIRAVLLTGRGRAFSAGDDVKSMGELPFELPPGSHPVREMQQRLIRTWYWLRKPTVVAVRGRAHGIGQDLVLAADFRIVSRTTVFGDMRAKRAVPVGSGGTWLLPRMIGLPRATELMLTGDVVDAEVMDRLGLATRLVDDEKLDAEALEFAATLAKGPTKALGIMKHELRSNISAGFDDALALEMSWLDVPTEDRAEGGKSFAEGREPTYTGR
jgi:2-(1,2-epoxy-1,2-dihydrophenyl)acetyl-CoA isomerase